MSNGKNNGQMQLEECLIDASLEEFTSIASGHWDLLEEIVRTINQRKLTAETEFESFMERNKSKSMLFQIGYTPNNLKRLIEISGLSQKDFYEHLGKSRNAFGRYLLPVDDANHVTMKHKDWEVVLNYVVTIVEKRSQK